MVDRKGRVILNKNRGLSLVFIGSILIVSVVLYRLKSGDVPFIDQWTDQYAANIESTSLLYSFFKTVTHFGSRIFLVPCTIILIVPFYRMFRTIKPWIILSGGTLFAHLLNMGIKEVVKRDRPQIVSELAAEGFSFPSGHAMISTVFYSLLIYFLLKRFSNRLLRTIIWISGILAIILIGTSRYFLYVHYMSDIVVGYIIGFVLVRLMIRLCKTYRIGEIKPSSFPPS